MKHPIPVTLSETDRVSLHTFIHAGKANARTFTRARILWHPPTKAGPTSRSVQPWTSAATRPFACGSCTQDRRIRGSAARQATTAISPSLDWWTSSPSDCHRVQSRPRLSTTIGPCACWLARPSNWADALVDLSLFRLVFPEHWRKVVESGQIALTT